jgi:hypothetical protein
VAKVNHHRRAEFPPIVVGVLVYALVLDFLVLVAARSPLSDWNWAFSRPLVVAWLAVVAGQVAIWVMLVQPILTRFAPYRPILAKRRLEATALALGAFLMFVLLLLGNRTVPDTIIFLVAAQKTKVLFITVLGFAVALPCLLGMRYTSVAARELAEQVSQRGQTAVTAGDLERFRAYREDLDWFLSITGLIVAGATLSTGVVRVAFSELNGREVVSAANVLLYGGFCSALIAAIYIPAFAAVGLSGRRVVEAIVPLDPGSTPADWVVAFENRSKFAGILGLNTSAWDKLSGGLVVVAPLASGALSFIL